MCTVTYIPFKDITFITSNRDESLLRRSHGLISRHHPEQCTIYFPLDESSGGSWIALSETGRTVCLLNGGFRPFIPDPPYRMSRGQIVIESILSSDIPLWISNTDLERIAPFTMVILDQGTLTQLVWDGIKKDIQLLPVDQPKIWSSVTLYNPDVISWRKSLFEKWLTETENINRESIIAFHQMPNGDPANDFIMNRGNQVQTLSITSILLQEKTGSIVHLELDKNRREEILIHHE